MTQQQIYEWIRRPEMLNRESLYELRTLLARYPYFQTARLLYLKNLFLLHDASFDEELRKAALYIVDRKVLFSLIEGERFSLKALKKEVLQTETLGVDRTLSLIDAFLSTLPEDEPIGNELLEVTPEITSDYATFLMQQPDVTETDTNRGGIEPKLKGQELIDSFLEKVETEPVVALDLGKELEEPAEESSDEPEEPELPLDAENLDDESYFTETLAKIYVKQQRYSKALEIIKKLNLKYPKKNAYFADQIRFLEKLIINAKSE